jgi:uncharacterized phage protein gp47/JayE
VSFTVKSFEDIVADMITWIVSNSSKITDITPGSVIRSFCEGTALSMEELYVSTYLGFRRYLDNIQETAFDFERKSGTKSEVDVVFTRTVVGGTDVIIPIGTRLKTASGLKFKTTETATITAGNNDSNAVSAESDEVGTANNIGAGTLTIIEDNIANVDSVTNALAATGGVNEESDIAFKKRFQAYIEGLGRSNIAGLSAGALSVEGITSVSVVELFPPVANVNVDLYIDDGTAAGVTSAQITEVQSIIDGDGTEENPGYRAAGINVQVKAPNIVTQDITLDATILSGVDTDQLQNDVINNLTEYVNTLGVGNSIIYSELVAAVMAVYGISDVSITDPSANVAITSTQVGRIGTITINMV